MARSLTDGDATRTIGAVENSCLIIEYLHSMGGARIRDLAEHLDISKGAIHHHLATLRKNGYVIQDGNEYKISLRFLEIGEVAKSRAQIVQAEKNNLRELAEATDTRVQLIREEFGMSGVLKMISNGHAIEPSTRIGRREHLHCTASGKAILAYLSEDRVEGIIDKHGLPARTKNTITDRERLSECLDEVRETGVAFNDGEKIRGLRAVGAPILTDNDSVLGAVSASAPISEMQGERYESVVPDQVLSTANAIALNVRIQKVGSGDAELNDGRL
jgi:DNA-binding IclR family transcriptional regulator